MREKAIILWNEKRKACIGAISTLVVVVVIMIVMVVLLLGKSEKTQVAGNQDELAKQTTVQETKKDDNRITQATTKAEETTEAESSTVGETTVEENTNASQQVVVNTNTEGQNDNQSRDNGGDQPETAASEVTPQPEATPAPTEPAPTSVPVYGANGVITTELTAYTTSGYGEFSVPKTVEEYKRLTRTEDPDNHALTCSVKYVKGNSYFGDGIMFNQSTIQDVIERYGNPLMINDSGEYIYRYGEEIYISYRVTNGTVYEIRIGNYKVITRTN